jgi:hypothetical protein
MPSSRHPPRGGPLARKRAVPSLQTRPSAPPRCFRRRGRAAQEAGAHGSARGPALGRSPCENPRSGQDSGVAAPPCTDDYLPERTRPRHRRLRLQAGPGRARLRGCRARPHRRPAQHSATLLKIYTLRLPHRIPSSRCWNARRGATRKERRRATVAARERPGSRPWTGRPGGSCRPPSRTKQPREGGLEGGALRGAPHASVVPRAGARCRHVRTAGAGKIPASGQVRRHPALRCCSNA